MALQLSDAQAFAMRGLAFAGAPRQSASSRKYAVTSSGATVLFPVDANNNLPSLMRFSLPAGTVLYGEMGSDVAAVPTTSADGGFQIVDGDVLAPWGADRVRLISEANATITITFLWT